MIVLLFKNLYSVIYTWRDLKNALIFQHNGSCNAYTSSDHTNYYFDISPDVLEGALDR